MVKIKSGTGEVIMLTMVALVIAIFVSGRFGSGVTYADTSNLSMAATIQPSMTITVSDASKTLDITPSSDGTFGSTSITVGAYSNGSVGYTLTMTPSNTSLTSLLGTIPTLSSASTCNGGTACSSSNFQVGRWGIAVGNAVYGPAAATNLVTVANTNANANVSSNTYTINLGANLDLSTPIDRYSTTLNFAATAEVRTYAITYTYDSGITDIALKDSDNNTVTPTSTASGSKTYDLYYANSYTVVPTYAHSSLSSYGDISVAVGAGLLNRDTYTYIVGAGTGTVAITTIPSMQGMTGSLCTATPIDVYDDRDGQIYKVARALDGNCWMIQNLKLGKTTASLALTNADSDTDASGFTLDGKLPDGIFTYTTVDGTNYQNNSSQYYCTDDYGCYYNWYAATAGSGTTATASENDVNYSICPRGWTLPTGGAGGQFSVLNSYYNKIALMLVDNPTTTKENTAGNVPGFLLDGSYDSSGASFIGSVGFYWSRTAYNAAFARNLYIDSSHSISTYTLSKYIGLSVRCVFR